MTLIRNRPPLELEDEHGDSLVFTVDGNNRLWIEGDSSSGDYEFRPGSDALLAVQTWIEGLDKPPAVE